MPRPVALCFAACLSTPDDTPTDAAVKLVNQGNVDQAIQVLRDHLAKTEEDVQAWVVLGRILDFDGRPDEAVALWEKGLTGEPSDVPLLMSIGEIRHRQGRDGPNISYRRGMVGAHPSKNKDEEEPFKAKRLEEAATAYEKAMKLRAGDPKISSSLASVYSAQKKYDDAANVWKSLVKLEPRNAEYHLSLAMATKSAGRADEAADHLKQAIALNKNLSQAHHALAEIQKARGQTAEAELSRKRAEFYGRLPSFCTLEFSEANVKILDDLNREAAVRKLIDDPSDEATQFLATVCWSHPHNQLETQAFQALEARGAKTTPLLKAMIDDARSTCTIKSTAHILARRKADGLFDFLVERLPGDLHMFGMDMDIAGSLDDLGDPRAVGPLVQFLNPGYADAGTEDGMLSDRRSAQARATLALGAFATPESKVALDAAMRVPRLKPYALAAVYRQTRNLEHVAALERSVGTDDAYTSYLVGDYLLTKVGTKEARRLAGKWEKEREAAEDARKKLESGKKAKDEP